MALEDIPLSYKPGEINITKGVKDLAETQHALASANLENTQSAYQRARLGALSAMGDLIDKGVPIEEAVKPLNRVDPETGQKVLEGHQKGLDIKGSRKFAQSGDPRDLGQSPSLMPAAASALESHQKRGREYLSGQAYAWLKETDPQKRLKLQQDLFDKGLQNGWIPPQVHQMYRNSTNESALKGLFNAYLGPQGAAEVSGEAAGNQAAERAPFDAKVTKPEESITYPGVNPNAPSAQPPPPGSVRAAPIVPKVVKTTSVTKPDTTLPYYDEIPAQKMMTTTEGPGVVQQGVPQQVLENQNLAAKKLEELSEAATNSVKTQASTGTMRSALASGKLKTGKLSDFRYTLAGYLSGSGVMDRDQAAKAAGLDAPTAEIFEKESTRMGLTFARQTEGAREAVMAIQIALRANPHLLTTAEGNKTILDIIDAGAKWDQERSKAANTYFRKQMDVNSGHGHLVGFDNWWNEKHPPGIEVSKAFPYQLPETQAELKQGHTYQWATKDGKRVPINTEGAKIVKGRYEGNEFKHD